MATRDAHDDLIEDALTQSFDGEQAGFTALYQLLAGRVAGYVRGRGVRNVDDVTNEIFLAAFRQLPHRDFTAAGFRAWLFGIAFRKTVDWHRAVRRRPAISDDTVEDEQHPAGDAEVDALEALGDEHAVAMLDVLTDDQRSVLLLRVVADLSLDETAIALDKPVGAVKSLQRRALEALRRHVGGPVDRDSDNTAEQGRREISDRAVTSGDPQTMTTTR